MTGGKVTSNVLLIRAPQAVAASAEAHRVLARHAPDRATRSALLAQACSRFQRSLGHWDRLGGKFQSHSAKARLEVQTCQAEQLAENYEAPR